MYSWVLALDGELRLLEDVTPVFYVFWSVESHMMKKIVEDSGFRKWSMVNS